jgi:hypothetical protein
LSPRRKDSNLPFCSSSSCPVSISCLRITRRETESHQVCHSPLKPGDKDSHSQYRPPHPVLRAAPCTLCTSSSGVGVGCREHHIILESITRRKVLSPCWATPWWDHSLNHKTLGWKRVTRKIATFILKLCC